MGFIQSILSALGPELSAAVASGIVYFANKVTGIIAGWSDWAKRAAYVVLTTGIGWVGSHFGLDVSGPAAFGAALVALVLFHIGAATKA